MGGAQVMKRGALSIQVCVPNDWDDAAIKQFADRERALCGTSRGWSIRKEGDKLLEGSPERVQCGDDPRFVHIMLDA